MTRMINLMEQKMEKHRGLVVGIAMMEPEYIPVLTMSQSLI